MSKHLLLASLFCCAAALPAQRLFLDIPHIYFAGPDAENVGHQMGLGVGTALNVGTHWGVARIGGGADFTADPKADDVQESFRTTPYGLFEMGVGIYRSNGNKCARTKRGAFTAMAKTGVRYRHNTKDVIAASENDLYGTNVTAGVEVGYFYIRDIFKNYEVTASADYLTQAKVVSFSAGFKLFLNLRANR